MKKVDKPWGHEEIITHTDKYIMKKVFIKAGHRLSKQFHLKKGETIYVEDGVFLLDLSQEDGESNIITLHKGGVWHIPPKTIHRFTTPENSSATLIEVSTPELEDVVRLSDDYGRTNA
jgi:mannose-6-phosphate isomerase